MDPITHALLGASAAEALLFSCDKKRAWIAGGLASLAPDLDMLIRSTTDPLLPFIYHRQFSHALAFMPIGGLMVALGLLLFKSFRPRWWLVLLASLIGYASHAPLDALTSYGTVMFWPFSHARISLDMVSIVDPFFTFPLAAGLAWTLICNQRRGVVIGLLAAAVFLGFNAVQQQRVLATARTYAEKHHIEVKRIRAFPALASSTFWRLLLETEQHFILMHAYAPVTQVSHARKIAEFPVFNRRKLPAYVKDSPTLLRDFKVFAWFTDGYLIAVHRNPLHLIDGRYLIGQEPPVALWGILFKPGQTHVERTQFITLESAP